MMPDDSKKRGAADASRVNVYKWGEIRYWCGEFKCTEAELCLAVAAAGPMVTDVRRYLESKRPQRTKG